jgi:ammonium transporter, Amt family
MQLGFQLADSVSSCVYSFIGTCLILMVLDFLSKYIPVLELRATKEEEARGMDVVEISESSVSFQRMKLQYDFN